MPKGRPAKIERSKALSIYPETDVRKRIEAIAQADDRPVGKVAVILIREALEAREKAHA